MTPFDTASILHISLWESWRPENWTIFSIITGRILVGMIATLVWDGNLLTATGHSWMWSTQTRQTAFGAIGERRLARTGQKWWSTTEVCQRVARGLLIIVRGLCWHWHRFLQAAQQNGRVVPYNWRSVYYWEMLSLRSLNLCVGFIVTAILNWWRGTHMCVSKLCHHWSR